MLERGEKVTAVGRGFHGVVARDESGEFIRRDGCGATRASDRHEPLELVEAPLDATLGDAPFEGRLVERLVGMLHGLGRGMDGVAIVSGLDEATRGGERSLRLLEALRREYRCVDRSRVLDTMRR